MKDLWPILQDGIILSFLIMMFVGLYLQHNFGICLPRVGWEYWVEFPLLGFIIGTLVVNLAIKLYAVKPRLHRD